MSAHLVITIDIETNLIIHAGFYSEPEPTGKPFVYSNVCVISDDGRDYCAARDRVLKRAAFEYPWLVKVMGKSDTVEMKLEIRKLVENGYLSWEKWLK